MQVTLSQELYPNQLASWCQSMGNTWSDPVRHLCTDSREAGPQTVFCAIRGAKTDGHQYIQRAYEAGCRCFLCETESPYLQSEELDPSIQIIVPDTVAAFAIMADQYRRAMYPQIKTVAITGSVGKTTTKECVAAVLGQSGKTVFCKEGNYNSTIGLPLSMLEIPENTELAVLEMGMSGLGEISTMSRAARPNIGIITNVGTSHMEYLGSRENIAKAKLEICEGLQDGGTLLINGDEPLLADVCSDRFSVLSVSATGSHADFYAEHIRSCGEGMMFDAVTPNGRYLNLYIPAIGEHIVWAAMFAVAAGCLLGESEAQLRNGLNSYRPANMRQHIRHSDDVTVIEDCYNAAPESMKAALSVLETVAVGRRVAVLGDMKELGRVSEVQHRLVGAACVERGVDLLVTVGDMGKWIAEGAIAAGMDPSCVWVTGGTDTYEDTAARLKNELRANDAVLVKASRSMALEKLAALL